MTSITTALRRTLLLLVVAAGVGAAVSWRRGSSATPTPSAAPQWPPLPEPTPVPAPVPDDVPTPQDTPVPQDAPTPQDAPRWLPPLADGSVPAGHPIKANDSSMIFHVPNGRFYDRTKPERCYATAADAEADGYRPSKS
jgi:hypothetical protein